ncbi:MAG: hypothetical protein GC160_21315 [Acidobacteria bacterium]|nr:hypothetical protein [Acidobacteriota bacterium]
MGRVVRAGLLYFLLVAAAGFVLGPIRVLWIAPRLGERTAELLEMPVMVGVIWFAARRTARRLDGAPARLAAGSLALALMLAVELTVVLQLRGLTLEQGLAARDPVSGSAYALALLFMAFAPAVAGSHRAGG